MFQTAASPTQLLRFASVIYRAKGCFAVYVEENILCTQGTISPSWRAGLAALAVSRVLYSSRVGVNTNEPINKTT